MNQQLYRSAVGSIHWSAEKRAEIEEILRQQPEKALSVQKTKHRSVTKEHMTYKQSEVTIMANKKVRRMMAAGFGAVVLATCGAVGVLVSYAKKHPQIINTTWLNGITLHLTNEESYEPSTSYWYNNNNHQNFEWCIVPTGSGWFFRKEVPMEETLTDPQTGTTFSTQFFRQTLCYADKATGQAVTVCAKPNCLHDGNAYCTATTDNYEQSYLTYYDGYLYAVTTKFQNTDNRSEREFGTSNPAECEQVLIRYSPDGTQIEELAHFGNGIGTSKCIVHRGYVWCIVQLQTRGEEIENPISHNTTYFESGGWQLWGYELATGYSAVIYDAMGDPEINHVNEAPFGLSAAGDYLYFYRIGSDWSGGQGFCRISLLTGEVSNGEEEVLITGMHYICHSKTHAIRSWSEPDDNGGDFLHYYLIDLDTLEETELFDSESVLKKLKGTEAEDAAGIMISAMDEQYIYAQTALMNYAADSYSEETYILIFDFEGNLVKAVPTGMKYNQKVDRYKDEDGKYQRKTATESVLTVAVDSDTIYMLHTIDGNKDTIEKFKMKRTKEIIYCSLDDLLSDQPLNWKTAYSIIPEEVQNNAE